MERTPVLRADVAALTLDMLSDRDARLAGFGDTDVFDFPFPVAVKTGTSRHFTDNWAVAVTGTFTVAVWVGNFDGTPMAAVSGISGAGPLLRRVVFAAAQRYAPGPLPSPEQYGATRVRVCRVSGMAAVQDCDAVAEWQLATHEPLPPDTWHRDGAVVLPARFAEWQRRQLQQLDIDPTAVATRNDVAGESADGAGALRLLSPRDGDVYRLPVGPARQVATVALQATGARAEELEWTVDDRRVSSGRWHLEPGVHVIRVRASTGAMAEARIEVRAASRVATRE